MFERIYIEKSLQKDPSTLLKIEKTINRFPTASIFYIDNYRDVFGKFYKPYLAKRDHLWLFLAHKKGELVKPTPPAYGTKSGKHFYFVHAYNCIYECQYCYLQGYFHSPDIVLFLNHGEILQNIEETILLHREQHPKEEIWFHAGEYSDSLALSDLSGELAEFFELFKKYPEAKLELRTKSIKIQELLTLPALPNIFVSFSLSSERNTREIDIRTPKLDLKLKAISKLANHGYYLGLHFDPIVYNESFDQDYYQLVNEIGLVLTREQIERQLAYISIGVVRFTKDVHSKVTKNYPDSTMFSYEMIKSFDGKMRYPKPLRFHLMEKVKTWLKTIGVREEIIYLCMEDGEETMDNLTSSPHETE